MKSWKLVTCVVPLILILGCGKKKSTDDSSEDGVTSSGSLFVEISTAWQDDASNFEVQKDCSAFGTNTVPDAVTCDVPIPEEQLNLSELKISASRTGDGCAVIKFAPYFYRLSVNAAYIPLGETDPIDCSTPFTIGDPLECWGGAGQEIVPGFPQFLYLFTTSNLLEATISSPNEKAQPTNRYVANDLAASSRATSVPPSTFFEGYVGSSMVDYSVSCVDVWANTLSTITINIKDFDGSSPTTNNIDSWNN